MGEVGVSSGRVILVLREDVFYRVSLVFCVFRGLLFVVIGGIIMDIVIGGFIRLVMILTGCIKKCVKTVKI